MKYVLFALGLLLLFIGAYSVYFGYGIIEVERGWASVIAGTTAFVGGLLIIGVAWIIRTLEQIRALLRANAADVSVQSGAVAYEALQAAPGAQGPGIGLPIPAAAMSWPPQTFPVYTTPGLSEAAPRFEPEAAESDADEAVPEETQPGLFAAEATETVRTPTIASPPSFAPAPLMERAKPSVKDLWRRIAHETEAKSSDAGPEAPKEPEAAALVQPPPLPPLMAFPAPAEPRERLPVVEHDDWLDHAFAERDATLAPTASSEGSQSNAAEPSASEPVASTPEVV
ncbi:MAG TPA: hypothetical protein VIJ06_01305, partial [Methylovirgula sp.]